MIERWNEVVKPNDIVHHLGDLSFNNSVETYKLIQRLNGRIYLIKGNHNRWLNKQTRSLLHSVDNLLNVKIKDRLIVLCHYPMRTWDKAFHGSYHLFGHIHGAGHGLGHLRCMDMSVECHNYYPIEFEQIDSILKDKAVNNI